MMKTTNFIKTTAFSLLIFMSVSSIANPYNTGDETTTSEFAVNTETEFSYLRFDADKFVNEREVSELLATSIDYLRFDVNDFAATGETEIFELPVTVGLDYLRFDVIHYSSNISEITEMPETKFNSLCFDVNKYSIGNTPDIDELPVD